MRQEQQRRRAEALSAHTPVQPTLPADAALARNGERQLMSLSQAQLRIVELLLASDIYTINQRLRTGRSLEAGGGVMIDYAEYESMQEFVDAACGVLDFLGSSLTLDGTVRLFRGIGIPSVPEEHSPDIAGIGGHLATGGSWHPSFADAGFGFATTDPQTALSYNGNHVGGSLLPVLLELDVHWGLCIPRQEHRSHALFAHCYDIELMSTEVLVSQVIFAPGTRWNVLSVDRNSKYQVPLVRMEQLMP